LGDEAKRHRSSSSISFKTFYKDTNIIMNIVYVCKDLTTALSVEAEQPRCEDD
jgi:hypothetical protein